MTRRAPGSVDDPGAGMDRRGSAARGPARTRAKGPAAVVPSHEARQWKQLFLVHLAVGVLGLTLSILLPDTSIHRPTLVFIVLGVYLPLAAITQLVLPGPPPPWTLGWWLVLAVVLGIIGLFQGAFPALEVPALLGYVLDVVVAGHLYGLRPALVVAAAAEAAAVSAHLLGDPAITNPFILAMLAVFLASAAYLVGGLASERWRAYEALERARSDFMSTVSHELRTPIAGIQAFSQMLSMHWAILSEEERRQLVDKIQGHVRFLDDLVSRLLDITRLDEGRFMVWREPCDLLELTRETVGRLEPILGGREVRVDGSAAWGLVDRLALDRVLENLVSNALKYSLPEAPIEVSVGSAPPGPWIAVRDHGPGVPEHERALVFERFYRSPGTQAAGTGLGLSVVRQLVELQGGRVRVEDARPGARFVVTLAPAGVPPVAGASPPADAPSGEELAAS